MVRIILKLAINFCFLILLSAPAYANIGSITEFRGAGKIKRGPTMVTAAKGSSIVKNDTVSTSSQGRFKITFVDNTTVNITENSRLVIDDFVYDAGGKSKGKLGLKIALGTVRYASGKLAQGNPGGVNIRTPTATIGVRGTDFVMSVDEIGRTMIVLLPSCFDDKDPTKNIDNCPVGAIDVTTPSGKVSMDKPFQATVVESASVPPSTPVVVKMDLARVDNSLQVGTVQTSSGVSVVQAARQEAKEVSSPAAAASDSNAMPDLGVSNSNDGATDSTSSAAGETVAQIAQQATEEPVSVTVAAAREESNPDTVVVQQTTQTTIIQTTPPEPPKPPEPLQSIDSKIQPIYEKVAVVGWMYTSTSQNRAHVANVVLPKDSKIELVVIQDNVVDTYNFNGQSYPNPGLVTPEGTIMIRQTSAP
jgi:hypothetical protein